MTRSITDLLALERMMEAVAEFDAQMNFVGGCGNGFCCVTGKATGQHTNGACRCSTDKMKAQRVMMAAQKLRAALASGEEPQP
jgi:hypothetical protein